MGDSLKDLAAVFAGLSNEARLKMLYLLLTREELCVCDFVEALRITQSMASRHLRCLYHLGLVQDRRDATWMHYRIAHRLDPRRKAILRALRGWLEGAELDALDARLRAWIQGKPCGELIPSTRRRVRTRKTTKGGRR
jgi:ArsR family transcriptional regulator